jgi:hypothetical protein
MNKPYDVFESVRDGHIWIGTAKSVQEAIELIGKHPNKGGSCYLVYCQETHQPSYFKKENNQVVEAHAV